MKKQTRYNKLTLVKFLLKSGLAIVFFYAAISSLLQPNNWIGFVPDFIEILISKELFLILFSTFELVIGFLLLADFKTFTVSILSSITLFVIIFGNINQLEIIFRDIAILFMSLALSVLSKNER